MQNSFMAGIENIFFKLSNFKLLLHTSETTPSAKFLYPSTKVRSPFALLPQL